MEAHEVLGADGLYQIRVCTPRIERCVNDCTEEGLYVHVPVVRGCTE